MGVEISYIWGVVQINKYIKIIGSQIPHCQREGENY